MKHAAEEVTCPIITNPQPGNYHFEMRCEDCDVHFRLARATLGEVEDLYHQGRITQDEFEGYRLAWDLLRPGGDPSQVLVSDFPTVRRITRKLIRAKGLEVPSVLPLSRTARWCIGKPGNKPSWPHCAYCWRADIFGGCEPIDCVACASRQCYGNGSGRGLCAVCLNGLLPGWGRSADEEICGYKGCDEPAVMRAPRVKQICMSHTERAKQSSGANALTMAEYLKARIIHRNSGEGWENWRWVE